MAALAALGCPRPDREVAPEWTRRVAEASPRVSCISMGQSFGLSQKLTDARLDRAEKLPVLRTKRNHGFTPQLVCALLLQKPRRACPRDFDAWVHVLFSQPTLLNLTINHINFVGFN